MEDADRLTESAANALLKAIEEPGARTVWLLCAPTLHDILPTIRSRCRHLQLRTPSNEAVAQYLIINEGVSPKMAEFAARVAQGHVGKARHLATNEAVRSRRNTILHIPNTINSIATAYLAAQKVVEIAKDEAEAISEALDEKELKELQAAWGQSQNSKMATGGAKAVKELEKEQKSRSTRITRDTLDGALLDLATYYRDIALVQAGHSQTMINEDLAESIMQNAERIPPAKTLKKLDAIMQAREALQRNGAPLLTMEALMCELAK